MTAAVTPKPSGAAGAGGGRLDVVIGRALGTVLMTLRGPLRQSTSGRFVGKVDKVLDEGPERVVIDLTEAVLDDHGVRVLRDVRSSADERAVQLVLTSRNPETLPDLA